MLKLACLLFAGALSAIVPLCAQETSSGISVPVTASAGVMDTQRLQLADPSGSPASEGLRLMLYPTLQLGPHWFAYSAVQVRLSPYFYYDAYYPEHEWYTDVIQAYAGYAIRGDKSSIVIKAGRLASAFGSFPLRYDDAQNPLLDQPLSYIQTITLRDDQLPCGVKDLRAQSYGYVASHCGGVAGWQRGMTPVTLYGLPGIQAEFSHGRIDARLQVTSGSPLNPRPVVDAGTYAQWTLGAGYSVRQGFRVGVSGFRGPYLASLLKPLLPAGTTVRDFPASAVGVDVQWEHGRFSATGEWQRFQFDSPNLTLAPSIQSSYLEVKTVLTPRLFVAARPAWLNSGGATDAAGIHTGQFAPDMSSYEVGGGIWVNRYELVKGSYEWLNIENHPGGRFNVWGFQFVTSFRPVDWAFR